MQGEKLINQLSDLTGLPNEMIQKELTRLMSKAGVNPQLVTLDEVRELLALYLQDVLLDAKAASDKEQSSAS